MLAVDVITLTSIQYYQLAGQYNRNDEPVNGHRLAKNDRNQVLCLDPWSFHSSANDGGAGGVNAKCRAHDAQRHGQGDPKGGPHIRGRFGEVPPNADPFASASEHIVKNCKKGLFKRRTSESKELTTSYSVV